jgi:hypothetical protein
MREAGSFGCRLERITIRVSARRLVNDLATLVDEPGGRRDLGPAEGEHRLSVAVVDARIGDGRLLEEVLGSLAVILDVDAEYGDLAGGSAVNDLTGLGAVLRQGLGQSLAGGSVCRRRLRLGPCQAAIVIAATAGGSVPPIERNP